MINELLSAEQYLEDNDIEIESAGRLEPIPRAAEKPNCLYSIQFKADGTISSVEPESAAGKKYLVLNNSSKALVFKYAKSATGKTGCVKKIERGLLATCKLAEIANTPALTALATRIQKTTAAVVYESIKHLEDCYFLLELASGDTVHSQQTYRIIENNLVGDDKEATETSVVLGDAKRLKIKLYSRNINNKCLTRYGDSKSYILTNRRKDKVKNILTTLVNNDLHRRLSFGNKTSAKTIHVFTSSTELIEGTITENEWIDNSRKMLARLNRPHESSFCGGFVLILHSPINGAWNVEYTAEWDVDQNKAMVDIWTKGISNINGNSWLGLYKPDLLSLTKFLQNKFSLDGSEIRAEFRHGWKLTDSYDLFAGRTGAIDKAIKILATEHVSYAIHRLNAFNRRQKKQKQKQQGDFRLLTASIGLVLQHKGIIMSAPENAEHWAVQLGRLFSLGNYIQKKYNAPGQPPSIMHGERYVQLALKEPRKAHALFLKKFLVPYLPYARSQKELGTAYFNFNKTQAALVEIPTKIKDDEILLLMNGYAWRPQQEKGDEKTWQDGGCSEVPPSPVAE